MFFNLQNRPKLQPSKFRLSTYNETNVPVKDCCILRITHVFTSIPVLFHVVDNDSPPMLGLLISNNLDLIRRIMEINRCVPDYLQQYIMILINRGGFRAAETSKMECFVIIVSGWKPLIIITKNSILDVAAALDPPLMREGEMLCIYLYYYSIVQLIIIHITLAPNCLVICETCNLLNVMLCSISYHLYNSKKTWKTPMEEW